MLNVCIWVILTYNMWRSFGVIQCAFPKKNVCNLKPARCGEQGTKSRAHEVYISMHIGIFDLEHVNVI